MTTEEQLIVVMFRRILLVPIYCTCTGMWLTVPETKSLVVKMKGCSIAVEGNCM